MDNGIYLDYAATTPVDNDVLAAALPYYGEVFYNPSSFHAGGQKAAAAAERARRQCAAAINADPSEIYFTSGGTEAINWAFSAAKNARRIAVSAIEHDAALACADNAARGGVAVDRVKPDKSGIVTPYALSGAISDDTDFVAVMTVNNIVGSVQPIKQLAAVAHSRGALFFTDAVQAVNGVKIDVRDSDVDMLAVSGHKFYAPKGVGFLYVKRGADIAPLLFGGAQERGKRGGTTDVPAVVAMGEAIAKASGGIDKYNTHAAEVSAAFCGALEFGENIECALSVPDIVCRRFVCGTKKIDGGRLVVALSLAGVYCSVGSACSAGSATPPRTLTEMGVEHPECCVRFSLGKYTDVEQARRAADIVNVTAEKLLSQSR